MRSSTSPTLFQRFRGRRDELTLLAEHFDRVCDEQRARIVLISGNAGIGKTRLAREFLAGVSTRRCCVLFAVASEYLCDPYRVIREALAENLADAASLMRLLDVSQTARASSAEASRAARFAAIEAHIRRRAAQRGTIVLLLDDLQWSDVASLEIIRHLPDRMRDVPLMIVGTLRDEGLENDPTRASLFAKMFREGAHRLALDPLGDREMLAALRDGAAGYGEISNPIFAEICRLAEGSPFVAEELLRATVEGGAIAADSRAVVAISIRTAVHQRIEELSHEDREILLAAAVIGREFDFRLLVEITGYTSEQIVRVLREARRLQIIVEANRAGWFGFRHAITREMLYAELLGLEAEALHRKIARALEADREAESLNELAYHWWAARDAERAIRYNELAGDRATEMHAFGDAARLYERALSAAPADSTVRPRLLERATFALCTIGQMQRAREHCTEAIARFEAEGSSMQAARLMLRVARIFYESGEVDEAIATVESVLRALETLPSPSLQFTAETTLGHFLALQGRAEALDVLDRARRFERDGEPIDRFREANSRAIALFYLGRYRAATSSYERALAIAEACGDGDLRAHALNNLGTVARTIGDLAKAKAFYAAGVEAARQLGLSRVLATLISNLAEAAVVSGDLASAAELNASLLADRTGITSVLLTAEAVDIRLRSLRLDLENPTWQECSAALDRAIAFGEAQLVVQAAGAVALCRIAAGDERSASAVVTRVVAAYGMLDCNAWFLEAVARVGTPDHIEAAKNALERGREGESLSAAAVSSLIDAWAAFRGGSAAAARAAALAAAEAFAKIGWPIEESMAWEVAGETHRALAIVQRIAATREVRRLEDLLGKRRSAATRAAGTLSRREEQVANLLVRSYSYREIGEQLGIGERTVETHAAMVYRKIGVKDRLELATRFRGEAS